MNTGLPSRSHMCHVPWYTWQANTHGAVIAAEQARLTHTTCFSITHFNSKTLDVQEGRWQAPPNNPLGGPSGSAAGSGRSPGRSATPGRTNRCGGPGGIPVRSHRGHVLAPEIRWQGCFLLPFTCFWARDISLPNGRSRQLGQKKSQVVASGGCGTQELLTIRKKIQNGAKAKNTKTASVPDRDVPLGSDNIHCAV